MKAKYFFIFSFFHFFILSARAQDVPEIALMLPLEKGGEVIDFYRGALLGLEDVRLRGIAADVTVWDTADSLDKVFNIVVSERFRNTDLIIGPVYEREAGYAVQFAELMSIPIVSPLVTLRELDSEYLFQMAPDPASKYDKLRGLWVDSPNVILVSSEAGNDAEFEREMEAELSGMDVGRYTVEDGVGADRRSTGSGIAGLIDWDRENIFVVLGAGEVAVDDALATISSSYNNASARQNRTARIKVVGSSRWGSYGRIDRNLYFKLGVRFVTSYYIDRQREEVREFDSRFLSAYGLVPTRAAFRGYDAIVIFVRALFEDGWSFDDRVESATERVATGVPYNFDWTPGLRRRINREWQLVEFSADYNVTVR